MDVEGKLLKAESRISVVEQRLSEVESALQSATQTATPDTKEDVGTNPVPEADVVPNSQSPAHANTLQADLQSVIALAESKPGQWIIGVIITTGASIGSYLNGSPLSPFVVGFGVFFNAVHGAVNLVLAALKKES